jgi:nitronate monooxygenase
VHGNYLRTSIIANGLDPDALPDGDLRSMNFDDATKTETKAWKDIWGSGQGIGPVAAVEPAAERIGRLADQYAEARQELTAQLAVS